MSDEELISVLCNKFCNDEDDYDERYTDIIYNSIEEKDKEIERLNNIIDELEKFVIQEENKNNETLKNKYKMGYQLSEKGEETIEIENDIYDYILDKLYKLKEGK